MGGNFLTLLCLKKVYLAFFDTISWVRIFMTTLGKLIKAREDDFLFKWTLEISRLFVRIRLQNGKTRFFVLF